MRPPTAVLRLVLALPLLLALAPSSQAHPYGPNGDFGLGIIINEPTGLTGKYWLSKDQALDFHIGVNAIEHGADVGLYFDYLFHFDTGLKSSALAMPLYIGPGVALIFDDDGYYCTRWNRCRRYHDDDLWLAIRMPLGLSFAFKKFAGEAFLEVASAIVIAPDVFFDFDVAVGFRFYLP